MYEIDRRLLALVIDRAFARVRDITLKGYCYKRAVAFHGQASTAGDNVTVRVSPVNALPCTLHVAVESVLWS